MRKDMNNLILVTPIKEHESQVMEFREKMLRNGESFYGCSGLLCAENEILITMAFVLNVQRSIIKCGICTVI